LLSLDLGEPLSPADKFQLEGIRSGMDDENDGVQAFARFERDILARSSSTASSVDRLVAASNAVLAAMDDYNEKNGTALGGPAFFELGRAIASLANTPAASSVGADADLIVRLRRQAHSESEASRFAAEAKSKRQAGNPTGECVYAWLKPEDTVSWKAAERLAALASPSHPASAGDETREALAFIDKFFEPWGSWKTVWWESEVSGDAAFSADNALKHVANILRRALSATPAQEGEGERCQKCGHSNLSWSAPSPLWNAVMRGGSIDGEPLFNDMVCASCFMELAEQVGIAWNWRVDAQQVNVPLETTTPSGRVWDAGRWLWVHPSKASPAQEGEGRWALVHCSHCDELPREDKS
jgi:hypothetical protein